MGEHRIPKQAAGRGTVTPRKLPGPLEERRAGILVMDIRHPPLGFVKDPDGYTRRKEARICWFLQRMVELRIPVFLFAQMFNSEIMAEERQRLIEPKVLAAAGEARIVLRERFDGFDNQKLDRLLRAERITDLGIIGKSKFESVLDTSRSARRNGYHVHTCNWLMYGTPPGATGFLEIVEANAFFMTLTSHHITASSMLRQFESFTKQ